MKKLNLLKLKQKFQEEGIKTFGAKELCWFFEVKPRAAQVFLHRNTKKDFLTRVRRDLYFFTDNPPHPFFLANQAYQPSYISLETALSNYHLIPETVYPITSVTSKPTQDLENFRLHLSYSRIKTVAFTGYSAHDIENETVLIAQPAKAVADYLYFVSLGKKEFNERLEWQQVDRQKLEAQVQLFSHKPLFNLLEKLLAKETI